MGGLFKTFRAGTTAAAILVVAIGCAPARKTPLALDTASARDGGQRSAEIVVQAVTVEAGNLKVLRKTSATVVPVMLSHVVGQGSGVVVRVERQAGDWVNKDQTVIQLDDRQLRLSLQTAQAALEAARINLSSGQDTTEQANPRLDLQVKSAESAVSAAQVTYDSRKALFGLGGATSADVDKAKSDLDMAQANLEAARAALDQNGKADVRNIAQLKIAVQQADFASQQTQLNLQHSSIKAPYAGQIVSVNVMPGEMVSPSAPAFVVASRDREVAFDVPPADAAGLPVGASVAFVLNGKSYYLKVRQSPDVPINGVVHIVASIPGSLPLSFGAVGMVSYSAVLGHGVIVPIPALQTNEDQNFVFTVSGGKAVVSPITVLGESGEAAAVQGVREGSTVILYPPPGLVEGAAVRTVPPARQISASQEGPR